MATKTVRNIETWRAKLGSGGVDGITGAPIEGVWLGWCFHDGRFYKPVEVPPHVADWLHLRIVPADYLWPFYINETFKTVEEALASAGDHFHILDAAEGKIEFNVVVETEEAKNE